MTETTQAETPRAEASRVETPRCPRCRLPLRHLTHGGITLAVCIECKGLWFEGAEVERVIGADEAQPFRENLSGPHSRQIGLSCPRGDGAMREVILELENYRAPACGCPSCGGVWMDKGDIARIRPHLPDPRIASDEHIEGLSLQVDEAQREADDARITLMEQEIKSRKRVWAFQFLNQFLLRLPVEVYNPVRNRPVATYALIATNLLVFILQIASPNGLLEYGLVPSAFLHHLAPWTIITSMFLHANLLHLAGNMYFLRVFGDNVEDRLGIAEYLGLYLLGGLGAALTFIASVPDATGPMVGASGAISAVMGAYVYLFPQRRIYFMIGIFLRRIRAVWYLGIWLALQFINAARGVEGVAWWAHIGGFAFGFAMAALHRSVLRRRLATLAAPAG